MRYFPGLSNRRDYQELLSYFVDILDTVHLERATGGRSPYGRYACTEESFRPTQAAMGLNRPCNLTLAARLTVNFGEEHGEA